jgi:putative ABC transport system permease protein
LSLLVGVLAIVVIQAGAGAARDAVLSQSVLTGGRAVSVGLEAPAGARALDNALQLRRVLSAHLGVYDGSSAVLFETEASVNERTMALLLFEGGLREVRPYPVRSGAWPAPSDGLELRLAVNTTAAAAMGVEPGSTVPVLVARIGQTVTGVVVAVIEDGQDEPAIYAPVPVNAAWVRELTAVVGAKVLARAGEVDEKRLRSLVSAEYQRVASSGAAPQVVRLDKEDAMARQLQAIALVFSVVAALSLLVGALGILNIGLATLRERSDELSLRRSFGATRTQVMAIVVVEGQLIALTAAACALLVGVGVFPALASLVSNGFQVTRQDFPTASAVIGVVAGCAAALIGSLAPALRAGRVPIASIMRG